jgi:hypothetical protein
MNDAEGFDLSDPSRRAEIADEPNPRAVGFPLPVGIRDAAPQTQVQGDPQRRAPAPPPRRALAISSASAGERPSGFQRAMNALRLALPLVQRVLPLLDGNVGTAVSNLLSPHLQAAPPPPPVDLAPIEDGLAELRAQHRELRNQVVEQNLSLKRVQDQLQMVREATDSNTLEQQKLLVDLKAVGKKVNLFAYFALTLLGLSVLLNVYLFLLIRHILP